MSATRDLLFDTAYGVATGSVSERTNAARVAVAAVTDAMVPKRSRDLGEVETQIEKVLGRRGAAKLIAQARELLKKPDQLKRWTVNDRPSVAILTGKSSVAAAEDLFDRLRAAGADVWFYEKSIKLGRRIRSEDDRALEESDYVLLLVSRDALKSNFVGYELDVVHWLEMKERRERLLPVIVDDLPFDELPAVLGPIRAIALRDSGIQGVVDAVGDRITEDKARKAKR